ncbi:nitroreductase family protein [Chitinophagaceae bacterium MMS25-I14]
MTQELFSALKQIITGRRTVKTAAMNGKQIDDATINELLSLADWAPTHGRTEPWRFIVYKGEALKNFCAAHAKIYWDNTAEDKRLQTSFDNLSNAGNMASHLIVAVMQRGANPKIPVIEEIAATSAAIEHVLLGATAEGISSFWNTGGMTHHPALREYLGFGEHDIVMGLLYFGYTDDEPKEGKRNIPVTEKVKWA